jgi:L-ascorbate metabolism protein UlaG (beta-lactamase superfamily)
MDDATERFARGSIFFVGTATVLVRYAGFTVLTDPNFLHRGDHVHLGYGLITPRLTDPAIDIEALPPLDAVVLSHLHGDHFDRVAEAKLDRSVPLLTTPHAAAALARKGFRATRPLRTWQSHTLRKGPATLCVTATPGRHGPALVHRLLPPVMGSVWEFRPADGGSAALRLYVTGDTLLHEDVHEVPRRHPDVDVALLHLGGTRILGILVTMDARQGVDMLRLVSPRVAIPIHYDDYPVFESPLSDFVRAVESAGLQDRVVWLERGQTYAFDVPAARLPGAAAARR